MKKTAQTLLSIGIFYICWKMLEQPTLDMQTITKWSTRPVVFWVLWGMEAMVMCWWLYDELGYRYLSVNPAVYMGWLWLGSALGLFLLRFRVMALVMVGIAAIPLAIMALFATVIIIVSIFSGPIRWN